MGINREYLGSFQNKLVSSSSKWVPKYILFLAKLKGEVRYFWNGKAQTYPMNYLLHVGVMLTNIYKSVHQPIPTSENMEHSGNFRVFGSKFVKFLVSILNWQVNSPSNSVSFLIVTTQNSPVSFKLIHFLLWIKRSHESPNL